MLLRIGAMLAKDRGDKENMTRDFDSVKKEHIDPLVNAVLSFTSLQKDSIVLNHPQS